ncbi:MAG: peptidoglycan-associated lipoprotein [Deltaproteobacteria bacterium]|jgi:peptidoglycan-associated lipoprotein|nr:peptidoglycan-associated lipoprotein [Deltaproteobacteria bacterium]
MQRRFIGKLVTTSLVVLLAGALGTGCALFGDDEADAGGGGGSGEFDAGDGGIGGGGGIGGTGGMGADGMKVAELETIYFDYDQATIRGDQRPTLRANAEAAGRHAEWRTIVIEGYCDERGSEEYNLALGERRANSVKQYLIDSGVASTRVDTVSFGESKPAVQGHDESAFRWNRRAEFRVIQ